MVPSGEHDCEPTGVSVSFLLWVWVNDLSMTVSYLVYPRPFLSIVTFCCLWRTSRNFSFSSVTRVLLEQLNVTRGHLDFSSDPGQVNPGYGWDNKQLSWFEAKAMVESEDKGYNDAEEGADDDGGVGPSKQASPPPAKKSKCDKDEGDDFLLYIDVLKAMC